MPNDASKSSELFIVDNSETEWKGLKYLQEWTDISKAFDIATGYFEIGSLLSLDGGWQKLDKIRILMGSDVSARTKQALIEGLKKDVNARLDSSIEQEKEKNDFLAGVPALIKAMRDGKIECRVYSKRKFHAKAYITHPRVAVIGSVALVGSSNFTVPGLTQNIELNIQVRGSGDVARLQEWFEKHWQEGEEVTPDIINLIERHTRDYTPFEVYAKAMEELFEHHTPTEQEWEKTESKMYPVLDRYQKEGYHSLLKIAKNHGGAFLCDGVGLGKTFIGLMIIERLVMRDKKRVLLLVPKSGRVAVWERTIIKYMPHLLNGFLSFKIYNHTDLMREPNPNGRDFPAEFNQMKEQADVVIIDEAHHFRNRGLGNADDGTIRSRYWKLYDIMGAKSVFLLTATPVNNHLTDFQHLIELFSRIENKNAFAGTLGIHNLPAHFQHLEKTLRAITLNEGMGELFEVNQVEAEKVLFEDNLFRELVVQRSRDYAKSSQLQHGCDQAIFPEKQPPRLATYSVKKTYGHLLASVEKAFTKKEQLFSLAIYYPLSKWIGEPKQLESFDVNRQKQLVRLIRIQFLKRFESSIHAFDASCQNLILKLLAFLEKNSLSPDEQKRLVRWKSMNDELLDYIRCQRKEFLDEEDSEEREELGDIFGDDFEWLSREDYDIDGIMDETYDDLKQLADFLAETRKMDASHDDKLQTLIKILKKDPVLKENKVLIFSEFMSTARYLKKQLLAAGINGVEEIDSATGRDRGEVIQNFAPYYNGTTSKDLKAESRHEIRVLISTDVLSEGLNLQDATRLINYDLHWNPVRLMQRIGRIDRRLDPRVEKKIIEDHPSQKEIRGKVSYWNFLPPDDLDGLLRLYSRVSEKTLRISKVFGIEGKKLLKPDDDYDALKDFLHSYEGTMTDMERIHLEYQKMVSDNPELEMILDLLPGRTFSGRAHVSAGAKALFMCYALPAEDKTLSEDVTGEARWTEDAGKIGWYLVDLSTGSIIEDSTKIASYIRSTRETPRQVKLPPADLRAARLKVEKHIKNTYLKHVQAPLGIKPDLKCWMELN